MPGEGEGQGQNQGQGQGQNQGGFGAGQVQGQGDGNTGSGDLNLKFSEQTSMSDFLKDYPQYANNKNFTKYNNVKDFMAGHESLVSHLGNSISIPNETSTQDDWNAFYDKLGRPTSADEYKFEDKLPEGWEIDKQLDRGYRDLAYEIGLNNTQAQKLREFYNTAVENAYKINQKETQTRLAELHETNVKEIKQMWGGDYQAKTKIAMNTARAILSQDTLDYLDATGLGNNAKLVRDFYELSKRLQGDSRQFNGEGYTPPTLEDLESESFKILRTPNWQNDPALKRKYEQLTQQRADMLYKEQ